MFEESHEVTFAAELKDEINVVNGLLDVDKPHNVIISAALQHLDLVVKKFGELA